jgi:glycosyltransferase involved in cell wall biosynthesis
MTEAASVLVTTHNRPDMLERCLRSVAAQTFSNFECVVVNDHPATRHEVDAVLARLGDRRFRVLHNDTNRGPAASRNRAVAVAVSPIIALLDDDDWWRPTFLEVHLRAHDVHPEAAIVYGGYERDATSLGLPSTPIRAMPPPAALFRAMLAGQFTFASTSILSIRKDAAVAAGGYDEGLHGFEDWDFACRLVQVGPAIALPEPLTVYTEHAGYRVSASIDEEFARIASKWSEYPEVRSFINRRRAEIEFNRSRSAVVANDRRSGWRHFARFVARARHTPSWPRSIALLLAHNLLGTRGYARLLAFLRNRFSP